MKTIAWMLFLYGAIPHHIYGQEKWELTKSKNGIEVYVTEVSGSDYYAFKAVMTVEASTIKIVEVLKEVDKYPEWFAFTASAKLMSQTFTKQFIFMETDYPWPYANECMNYQMNFGKKFQGKMKISISGLYTKVAECRSMKHAQGYILLESVGAHTQVTYCFHSEPSQSIPPGLINAMIDEMPYQTFLSLRDRLDFLSP